MFFFFGKIILLELNKILLININKKRLYYVYTIYAKKNIYKKWNDRYIYFII
jgi:hypothetical protein